MKRRSITSSATGNVTVESHCKRKPFKANCGVDPISEPVPPMLEE